MLNYSLLLKNGLAIGPSGHLCYAFLYELKDGKLDGFHLEEIEQITITYPTPPHYTKYLSDYHEILSSSLFKKLWKRSVYLSKDKLVFAFNPNTWSLTDVLIIGPLVRLAWETPNLMENIIDWKKKGYSENISILLGHFLTIEKNYESLVNKAHMLFKNDMGLQLILDDLKVFLERTDNKTIINQQDPEIYSFEHLFFLARSQENRLSKGFLHFIEKQVRNPFWTYKISDEAIQEICSNGETQT